MPDTATTEETEAATIDGAYIQAFDESQRVEGDEGQPCCESERCDAIPHGYVIDRDGGNHGGFCLRHGNDVMRALPSAEEVEATRRANEDAGFTQDDIL